MSSSTGRSELKELRERVLRRLQRLMELNADIDRNRSDSMYVQGGGEIKYVFDENIFEMFVRPYHHTDYVTAFASYPRSMDFDPSPETMAAAQSAMICSEYLFSGRLPGQRENRIYMSEWHFWELREQVEQRRQEFADYVANRSESFTQARQPFERLRALKDETRLDHLLHSADPQVSADVKDLREAKWPDDALWRFVFTSQAATLLATDMMTEPVMQLDRIFSDEIAPLLRPLHLDYPLDPGFREQLQNDTKMWMERLLAEQARRRARPGHVEFRERPYGSLANDARSLAYILWVARSRTQGARLVFVTGDHLLFDAYRRWHIERAPSEPFVLRRPLQFAPFINFNDTPNDVDGARFLFDRTREAVEVPLIAFNLGIRPKKSDPTPGSSPLQAAAQREDLLLRLMEPGSIQDDDSIGFFLRRLDRDWLQNQVTGGRELRAEWFRIERIAIGANYPLVSGRFDRMERMHKELEAETGAINMGSAVVTYVRRILDRIVSNSIRVWFPLAVEFIRSPASNNLHGFRPRVPIALRLRLFPQSDDNSGPQEIDALLDDWTMGKEKDKEQAGRMLDPRLNPLLAQRQHVVFAIAANLALRSSEWSQAQRYADLASIAANQMSNIATEDEPRSDAAECDYLKALAIRFRVGSFPPYGTAVTEDVWGRWVNTAVGILDGCETYHRSPFGPRRHILRELRAVSERAAVRLFYATWVAAADTGRLPRVVTPATGFHHLRDAFRDLRRCAEIHSEVLGETLDAPRSSFFERLERQYITNSAAAEVLAHLVRIKYDLHLDGCIVEEDGPILARIKGWLNGGASDQLPMVARVDLQAFMAIRFGDLDAPGWLRTFEADRAQASTLAIDRALLRAVNQMLAARSPP